MATDTEQEGYEGYEQPVDASEHLSGQRREALGVLYPNPGEMSQRMPLITILRGRSPDLYTLYLAMVEWEGWISIEQSRDINWSRLNPGDFLKEHAPSIQGRGRKEAVEVGRATPSVQKRRSLVDLLTGR